MVVGPIGLFSLVNNTNNQTTTFPPPDLQYAASFRSVGRFLNLAAASPAVSASVSHSRGCFPSSETASATLTIIFPGESSKSSVSAIKMVEEGPNQPKIAPKRMKLQEMVEKGEEDRMSELPDCLLIEILSRLPSTKYAIRTGTLSKRWKLLWTLVPTLIFNHRNDNNVPWSDYASFVDKTLTQCRHLKLKKFQVTTCSDIQSGLQVSNWIRYAIRCNVEELNLNFLRVADKFLLDQSFFINTCFTDLILTDSIFYPIGLISWKKLKRLCISFVDDLNEALIEDILSGSPLLESLELISYFGVRRLDITSKSLRNLVLDGFFASSQHHDTGEIKAPNLLSLTIKGNVRFRKLLLVNMSSLVEANLSYQKERYGYEEIQEAEEEMLKGLMSNLRHVKDLKIGASCSKVLSRLKAKGFNFPSNMKLL